jgi:2,3-bisphosphoglycerate-independent phosphoglycerate mutase
MKYVILVGDGMGDYPLPEYENKSPLQVANIPTIRGIAGTGEVRMVQTVPAGMTPGSDVCNMALLGYDAAENYTGRAAIECAGAGIPMQADEVAYRCNLVTVADGKMDDYSAGHITTEEGRALVTTLAEKLNRPGRTFHPGIQYRHLLVMQNGPVKIETQPPHDIAGKPAAEHLPSGERAAELRELMEASKEIFAAHPVNKRRVEEGKKPATQIWLWGQGSSMQLPSYEKLYGLSGRVITAVDLVKGLGNLTGLVPVEVPGATGFVDTNYDGKRDAAFKVLEENDVVYVHVEAPDECGHAGDAALKIKAIEDFDLRIVKPVFEWLEARGEEYRLMLCTDHRTPVALKGHTEEPVPMAVLNGPVGELNQSAAFDETVNNGVAECLVFDWVRELLHK